MPSIKNNFRSLLALCIAAWGVTLLNAAPPEITEAEKAACEIVAAHLSRGSEAIVERLAPSSPLAAMNASRAKAEIDARVGPKEGAAWELRTVARNFADRGAAFHVVFPSGAEDVLIFELVWNDGAWKVQSIRTLSEPLTIHRATDTTKAPEVVLRPSLASRSNQLWLLFLAPVLSIAGAWSRQRVPRASSAVLIAALIAFFVPVASMIDPAWFRTARFIPKEADDTRSSLLPMQDLAAARRGMALGETMEAGTTSSEAFEVLTLWRLSMPDRTHTSEEAQKELSSVRALASSPLASLLRARAALEAGRLPDAAREYQAFRSITPRHDAFWMEETLTAASLASSSQGSRPPDLPDGQQSRDASLLYARSIAHLLSGAGDDARTAFQEAWRTQPVSRKHLVSEGPIALLLRDPAISVLVNLRTPDEPAVADLALSRSPMAAPTGAEAVATGRFVRLRIGDGQLDIPGGSRIAPEGTKPVSPEALQRMELEMTMHRVASLRSPSLASASMQRLVEVAVETLADRNQWNRILELTDAITPQSEHVNPSLLTWRVRALIRERRINEARDLVNSGAMRRVMQRNPDASTLLELSELLADGGAWHDAILMTKTAASVPGAPDVTPILRRLDLRQQLADSAPAIRTAHFDLHTAPEVPVTVASRIGDLLEAELERLMPRFGLARFERVRVNIVGWREFSSTLTRSSHVVGFYDGEVTVPFGEVARFREEVVSILTHELTHAIVAQASRDAAPRWFQEGIATRMELVEEQPNIFGVTRVGQPYALDVLDAVLRGSFDADAVTEAYVTAQTFIRFLESSYGASSINRLIDSFRAGNGSEEALRAITGKSLQDVDREFRQWGRQNSDHFIDRTPWPYARFSTLGIDPKVREGIRFSRPRENQP